MLLLIALVLVAAATVHAQVPARQTSITGRIVSDATEEPVRRAHVIAYGTTTRVMSITSTDASGQFSFPSLPEDHYRIGVSRPPYVSSIADASASPTVFRLARGAVVSGHVDTALGRPQSGVPIVVRTAAGLEVGRATTDALGVYRLHGLPAGDLVVSAEGVALAAPLSLTTGEGRPQVNFTVPPTPQDGTTEVRSGPGRIAGRAISSDDSRPLSAVTVLLTGGTTATTETNGTGAFEFTRLPVGTYTLRLGAGAFAPQESAVVDVTETPVTDVRLRGLGLGSLSGVVRDDGGEPLAGMPVAVLRRSSVTEVPFLVPGASADTDEHGAYRISSLPPGDYLVCTCTGRIPRLDPAMLRQLIHQAPQPAQLLPFMTGTAAFTPATFYPGRARARDAMTVALTEGDDRFGIDITVPVAATHTVFGQLVAQGSAGLVGTTVRLVLAGDLPEAVAFTEITARRIAPDGRFSIPGVPPGDYAVIAYPVSRKGATGMTLVTVEDRDVSGVTVPVSSGGTVRGRVAFAPGATPPTGAELKSGRISLNSVEGGLLLTRLSDPSGILNLHTPLNSDGSFELSGVPPGQYRLTAGGFPLPWFSIESVTTSEGVATDHVFTVESDGHTDVTLTMSALPPATVAGSVHLEPGADPRLNIVLVTSDWRSRRSFFRDGEGFYAQFAQPDGTFLFPAVPAGDYFIVAATRAEFQLTEARLTQWEKSAMRVTLRPGEKASIALKR